MKNLDKYHEYRRRCPYGIWTCADGREVLFNRHYQPIWERASPKTKARSLQPDERPQKDIEKQAWFFNDGNPPWQKPRLASGRATIERVNTILREWGCPEIGSPPILRRSA